MLKDIAGLSLLSIQVRFTMASNRFIDFLRRLGLSHGRNATDGREVSTLFAVLGALIMVGKKLMLHLLFITVLLFLGAFVGQVVASGGFEAYGNSDDLTAGLTFSRAINGTLVVWLFVVFAGCITGVRSTTASARNHSTDETIVSYFCADPALYVKSRILTDRISEILLYLPLLLVAFIVAGIPLWGVIIALILLTSLRLLGEMGTLILFKHTGRYFGYGALSILGYALYIPAIIAPFYLVTADWATIFLSPVMIIVITLPGISSLIYLKNYHLYGEFIREKLHRNELRVNSRANSSNTGFSMMNFKDAQKWSKHINTENLRDDKFDGKTGFAYLNAIFFDRHKKYFTVKMTKMAAISLIPVALAIIFMLLFPDGDFFDISGGSFASVFNLAPVFFFIIYIVSMGRVVTASVFANCDIEMLNYSYYRTKETVLASFKSRFFYVLKLNLVITTVLALSVLVAVAIIFKGMDFRYACTFFVLLTSIGVLFSFNDLFLYYVLQPYDSDGKSKSTEYTIINIAVYAIAFINYQIRLELFTYTLVVFAITVVYLGAGLFIMRSTDLKNFRLK